MRNKSGNVYDMLCQALCAQMDLGCNEVVLNRKAQPLASPQLRTLVLKKKTDGQQSAQPHDIHSELASQTGFYLDQQPTFNSLQEHFEAIKDCTKCRLSEGRNKFVYGVGNVDADLLFIGEGPGAEEDRLGEPFVGRAGKLLDQILKAIDLTRDEVYIANMVKSRPPGNRDPQPDEMATCRPYLMEQIRLIRPKLICGLGRIAGQALLNTTTPLGKLRNQFHDFNGIPLLVTYHPAALLRFPAYKKDTWEDMKKLKARYVELRGGR